MKFIFLSHSYLNLSASLPYKCDTVKGWGRRDKYMGQFTERICKHLCWEKRGEGYNGMSVEVGEGGNGKGDDEYSPEGVKNLYEKKR